MANLSWGYKDKFKARARNDIKTRDESKVLYKAGETFEFIVTGYGGDHFGIDEYQGENVYCNIYFKDIEFALNMDKGTYRTYDNNGKVIEDTMPKTYDYIYSSIYDEEYSAH